MNKYEIRIKILDFDIDKSGNEVVTIEIDNGEGYKHQEIFRYGNIITIDVYKPDIIIGKET